MTTVYQSDDTHGRNVSSSKSLHTLKGVITHVYKEGRWEHATFAMRSEAGEDSSWLCYCDKSELTGFYLGGRPIELDYFLSRCRPSLYAPWPRRVPRVIEIRIGLEQATIPKSKQNTFAFKAAQASWASSIIAFFLFIFGTVAAKMPLGILGFLMILVGFTLGVVALFGTRKCGPKGILVPALVGLFFNGLLIFIFATNYFSARGAYGR
jgi:hypothetical protein